MSVEIWRTLRIGDRLRITQMPDEIWASHCETKALFQILVNQRIPVEVDRVDDDGYPWIEYVHTSSDGSTIYESLMIRHNGIELIKDNE